MASRSIAHQPRPAEWVEKVGRTTNRQQNTMSYVVPSRGRRVLGVADNPEAFLGLNGHHPSAQFRIAIRAADWSVKFLPETVRSFV